MAFSPRVWCFYTGLDALRSNSSLKALLLFLLYGRDAILCFLSEKNWLHSFCFSLCRLAQKLLPLNATISLCWTALILLSSPSWSWVPCSTLLGVIDGPPWSYKGATAPAAYTSPILENVLNYVKPPSSTYRSFDPSFANCALVGSLSCFREIDLMIYCMFYLFFMTISILSPKIVGTCGTYISWILLVVWLLSKKSEFISPLLLWHSARWELRWWVFTDALFVLILERAP